MSKENLSKYYLYFMMYAIIGWVYEVFLEVVIYQWGFSNRGVLYGPYCPVYGVGALAFIFCLNRFLKNKTIKQKILMIPLIFIACMFIATTIELIASYLCEFTLGSWPWQTYADYKYNFQARIALSPSIRFGIGGVIFLYLLQPLFEKFLSKFSDSKIKKISLIVLIIFLIDIVVTIISKIV